MDIKPWEYADFPAFNEPVPGATRVPTTGDEIGVTYHPDVPYATAGTTTLHLQILVPQTRNQTDATTYPCMVHVQGSAWMKQDRTALVPTLSRIAERGFVVAIVEYRHSGIASFPAQIQDARNTMPTPTICSSRAVRRAVRSRCSRRSRMPPTVPTWTTRRCRWRRTPPTCRMRRGA